MFQIKYSLFLKCLYILESFIRSSSALNVLYNEFCCEQYIFRSSDTNFTMLISLCIIGHTIFITQAESYVTVIGWWLQKLGKISYIWK